MGVRKNSRSKPEGAWRTLKLKNEVFEAFEEVKTALKSRHRKKSISNSDVMGFLLYLAKIALELEGNPKLEGIAEPPVYDMLTRFEGYSRSVSDYLGIPVEYVRGGVLWGLIERAGEVMQTDWKKGEYYLKLADEWFAEYHVHVFEDEVAGALKEVISNIYWIGQNNPHRGEIRGRLFKGVETLISRILSSPNIKVIRALVLAELDSGHMERAIGVLMRAMKYENSQNAIEMRKLISKFLEKTNGRLNNEEFINILRKLIEGSQPLSQELFIIETASEFTDVKPLYEEVLNRKYLLPEDRIDVAESMIRTAAKSRDSVLLRRAVEVARGELKKLRESSTPNWGHIRLSVAMTLLESGFGDMIDELKFPNEVPAVEYYLLLSLSKLREDYEAGWEEFKRFLSMAYAVVTREDCSFMSSRELFIPVEWSDEIERCMESLENERVNLQKLSISVYGSCCKEINAEELVIRTDNTSILQLRMDEPYELPKEVVAPLLKALIESGVSIENDFTKILAAELLRNYDKSLAKTLLEEVLASGISINRSNDVGFLKLLDNAGIDPLEALRSVLRRTSPKKYEVEWLAEAFVKALVFVKPPKEVLELITGGSILEVLAEQLGVGHERPLSTDFKRIQKRLLDSLVEAVVVANKRGYSLASRLVLDYGISTSFLPYLIRGLLREGNMEMADELTSRFGLGWFGQNDLKSLIEYRFEECISRLRYPLGNRTDSSKSIDCYKATLSLLRSSRKKLEEIEYKHLGGRLAGRSLAWRFGTTG